MAKRSLTELREEMRGVARGERAPAEIPAGAVLNLLAESSALDLLRLIAENEPGSVSELAELAHRAQSNVSRTLHQLATYGLVRLERDGKEVRPVLATREITVDLAHSTYRTVREKVAA